MSQTPAKRSRIDEIRGRRNAAEKNREKIAIIGVVAVVANNNTQTASSGPGNLVPLQESTFTTGAPMLGNPDVNFVLAEYSNFSCSHCATYHDEVAQIVDKFVRTGKARFVFQPAIFDPSGDGGASLNAAQAALCAAKQGKFWTMHEALFAAVRVRGTSAFTIPSLTEIAREQALDSVALGNCIQSGETLNIIQASLDFGSTLQIDGTPTMLYSEDSGKTFKRFDGHPYSVPPDVVAQVIDQNK
jgi:protein-disulfide isomerase